MAIGRKCIAWSVLAILVLAAGCARMSEGPDSPQDLSKIAGWHGVAPKSEDAFTFVVLTDRTDGAEPGAWEQAVREVNLLKPDFVLCIGDLIQGYTKDEAEALGMWKEVEAMTNKLDAPFFYCPGNHDTGNPMLSQLYLERHGVKGHPYYSFDYRDCHFVILDSNDAKTDEKSADEKLAAEKFAAEQIAWLKRDMASARDARHVFVLYHHPMWDDAKFWPLVRPLLPAAKTTIFNGHIHTLSYKLADGIPTYVLSVTGAKTAQDRLAGEYRMFAQVAVDAGKPTISFLPLGELQPASYAEFTTAYAPLQRGAEESAVPAAGGMYSFRQANPTSATVTVDLTWDADKWQVQPAQAHVTIAPGKTGQADFQLTPREGAGRPTLNAAYTLPGPDPARPAEFKRQTLVPIYAQMTIPRVADLKVDGDLSDWSAVKPLKVGELRQIFQGAEAWSGAKDSSYALRAAIGGDRLFVAVDIADDQLCTDAAKPYDNDTIEFFWDARAVEKRGAAMGARAGQLVLPLPAAAGGEVTPTWFVGGRPAPKGLVAASKRHEGGYTMEWSVPLAELGFASTPAAGQGLNLEVVLDDRDMEQGKPTLTRMSSSGANNCYASTAGYVRGTVK